MRMLWHLHAPHLSPVSCVLSLCLGRCSYRWTSCTEPPGLSKTLGLANMFHDRFWKDRIIFSLHFLLLNVRDCNGNESKKYDTAAAEGSRKGKNLAGNVMRSLRNGEPQVGEGSWAGMSCGQGWGRTTVCRTASVILWAVPLSQDLASCYFSPIANETQGKTCSPLTTDSETPTEHIKGGACCSSAIPCS